MPPRTACATIAAGCAEASQTRSRRRRPSGRYRQAADEDEEGDQEDRRRSTSRLPNSIQRWMSGSPVVAARREAGGRAPWPVRAAEAGLAQPDARAGQDDPDRGRRRRPARSAASRPETARAARRRTGAPGCGRPGGGPQRRHSRLGGRARTHRRSGLPGWHAGQRSGTSAGRRAAGAAVTSGPAACWPGSEAADSALAAARAADRWAPAQATMTQPIAAHSLAPAPGRAGSGPTSAATAGSRLIQMPNTPAGIRRSASSSSRYGITDDSSPIAGPAGEDAGPGQRTVGRAAAAGRYHQRGHHHRDDQA